MATAVKTECTVHEHADPRVRRTRKLLQDAFRTLIHKNRFSDISVQDITEEAGVNRATFYAHYVDKSDLGISVARTDLATSVMKMFAQRPDFTRDNLITFSVGVFDFIGGFHNGCPKAAADLHGSLSMGIEEELCDLVKTWLTHSKAYLRIFPGSRPETVASVISSSIYGAANRWARTSTREPAEDVCREIVGVLLKE